MTQKQGDDLFQRLAVVHRPDCALLQETAPDIEEAPSEQELLEALDSEAAAAYALACRSIYEDLRRIIGQLAGLMILGRLTKRVAFVEFEHIDTCRERWQEAADKLAVLRAPGALTAHKNRIAAAHDLCGQVLTAFRRLKTSASAEQDFDRMGAQIAQAYDHLSAASSDKARLQMVDFSHACCSCSGH